MRLMVSSAKQAEIHEFVRSDIRKRAHNSDLNVCSGLSSIYCNSLAGKYNWKRKKKMQPSIFMQKRMLALQLHFSLTNEG